MSQSRDDKEFDMTQFRNAVATSDALNPSSPVFLRGTLLLDALASGATALLMLAAGGVLADLLAIPAALLRGAGLVLIPYVVFVGYLGMREHAPRAAVWTVVAANVLWAAASLLLLVSGWLAPTMLGYAFVIAQALIVVLFGELQYVALKRQPTA
jgi:hypothetical protein